MGKYLHKFNNNEDFNLSVASEVKTPINVERLSELESGFEKYGFSDYTYTDGTNTYVAKCVWDLLYDQSTGQSVYISMCIDQNYEFLCMSMHQTPIQWTDIEKNICLLNLKKMGNSIKNWTPQSISSIASELNLGDIDDLSTLISHCTNTYNNAYSTEGQNIVFYEFQTGDLSRSFVVKKANDEVCLINDISEISNNVNFSAFLQTSDLLIPEWETVIQYTYTKPFVAKVQSNLYYNDFEYRFRLFYDAEKDRIGFYDNMNKECFKISKTIIDTEHIYVNNPLSIDINYKSETISNIDSCIFKFNGEKQILTSHFTGEYKDCYIGITKDDQIVYFKRINVLDTIINGVEEGGGNPEVYPTIAEKINGEWTSERFKKFIRIQNKTTFIN